MNSSIDPSANDRQEGSDARPVLMICYFFPPIVASGTTRSVTFAQLLPSFGWHPRILTVGTSKDPWVNSGGTVPDGMEIHRSRELAMGRFADLLHAVALRCCRLFGKELTKNVFREYLCLPDAQVLWSRILPGFSLARNADVVYASCSPYSSAVSAVLIGRLTGKPVVIDFRDAWSLNPHWHHSGFHAWTIKRLERWVVRNAAALILNTEGAGRLYREAYPDYAHRLSVIPNGYDELTPVTRSPSSDRFVIMHLGSFYGARCPDLLLEVLAELQHLPIDFIQIGGTFESAARFEGSVRMDIRPPVPREAALKLLEQASLLYLKQGFETGVTNYIAVAAKTYEYIATGLPILADVPPGDNADIVRDFSAQSYVVTNGDKQEIRSAILDAYERRNDPPAGIASTFVEKFDRRELTRQLAGVFDGVAGR